MVLSKKLMAGGLAALALLATSAAAFAAPAIATGNVNVRSGPGTQYSAIDTLRRGERVDVQQCSGSWCYVLKDGPDGWVSASYLDRGRPGGNWNDDNWGRPGGGWNDNNWGRPPNWNPAPPPRPPHWNPRPPRPQPWPVYPPSKPGNNNGGSVCFNGPNGYFCMGN